MKHTVLLALAVLMTAPTAMAQLERETYLDEMRRKIVLQDSVQALELRLRNITQRTDSINESAQKLQRETQRNERDYENLLSSKSRDIELREQLIRETDSLTALSTLNERNCENIRADLDNRMQTDARNIDDNLSRLEDVRNSVISSLDMELSEMEQIPYTRIDCQRISQIAQRLNEYSSDPGIIPLQERLGRIQANKSLYDMCQNGVATIITSGQLEELRSQLSRMRTNNDEQQHEKAEMTATLDKYATGANALRKYAVEVNRKRDGMSPYSLNSLHDDQAIVLDRNGGALRRQIEENTLAVPALSHLYETFNDELEADPTGHSYTETLILNLDTY